MNQLSLVDSQIADGQKLVLRLVHDGFDVTSACWLKAAEDNGWRLLIASTVVEERGLAPAYRAVQTTLQRFPGTTVSLGDVKVIAASNPITRDLLKIQRRCSGRARVRLGGGEIGGLTIEEAVIYPPPGETKPGLAAFEELKLRTDVEQTSWMDELLAPPSPQETRAVEQIVRELGISPDQAVYWVRQKREHETRAIPAGTVVNARVIAWEDDPNPLLLVEAPDGAKGVTFKNNTEPV
jgi:hypothetical protein